jgi:hypothetical protein
VSSLTSQCYIHRLCLTHPFCSCSTATASASTAALTKFAAAGAASRLTAAVLDLDEDDDEDEYNDDYKEDNDGDHFVVLVGKQPAARPPPGKKVPFPCVLGEVLCIMQDRLISNASRNNVDWSSHGTLMVMYSDLVKCRAPLSKLPRKLI